MDEAAKREALRDRIPRYKWDYMFEPDFVDRCYEVPSVHELLGGAGVVGVARFVAFPSFRPEQLCTLVYRPGEIEVSAVVGASSLWCALPLGVQHVMPPGFEDEPQEVFDPARSWRHSVVIPLHSAVCADLFGSWAHIRAAAALASDCDTFTYDGISYRHRVADVDGEMTANWGNPDPAEHPPQFELLRAYGALLRHFALEPGR